MKFRDRVVRVLHLVVFFWHIGTTYDITVNGSNMLVGFKCDCGKKLGDTSWGDFFA